MRRIKFITWLATTAALILLFVWQHESLAKLRAENDSLRRQIEQLSQAQSTGAPASADTALMPEQTTELLKLRGEVTQLRAQTNEIGLLRRENERLQTSLKEAKPSVSKVAAKKSPEDALPQDIHPRDSWAFRGYDSPDATVESMCWAMAHGDKSAFLAGFSPEMQAGMEKDLAGKDFAEEMKSVDNGEFRILDRQVQSDDEVVLTVYSTRKDANGNYNAGDSENTVFKKIGGEWKITDSAAPK